MAPAKSPASTRATRSPDCAACQAVEMPRMPPPITRRSYAALDSWSRVSARLGLRAGGRVRPEGRDALQGGHGRSHSSSSIQPMVRSTALSQFLYSRSRTSASMPRCPLGGPAPVGAQRVGVRPEADGEAGGVGGAEAGGLGDHRAHHGCVQDVGEGLHQQVVGGHAAVDLERGRARRRSPWSWRRLISRVCQAVASSTARAMCALVT